MNEENEEEFEKQTEEESELEKIGRVKWTKIFRVFLFRIPLWFVVLLLVIIGGWMGYRKIASDNPVNLRPSVQDARKVNIIITTCDEQIDKHDINIRKEELRLQKDLENTEHVEDAQVHINRDVDKNGISKCPRETSNNK
jgi:hypothetical protein